MQLVYNQQVREYIDMYALRKRALTERVMGLAQLYFPLFEQTLEIREFVAPVADFAAVRDFFERVNGILLAPVVLTN